MFLTSSKKRSVMFKGNRITVLLAALFFVMVFSQCSKKWDEHNAITDNALNDNLAEAISNTPNLSKFSDLLVKSGYDKVISSSKTYTVWAPTDQALQSLDPSITTDSVKLKMLLLIISLTSRTWQAVGETSV